MDSKVRRMEFRLTLNEGDLHDGEFRIHTTEGDTFKFKSYRSPHAWPFFETVRELGRAKIEAGRREANAHKEAFVQGFKL